MSRLSSFISVEWVGRHERMHGTLKLEAASPSASNLLLQQERFDEFVEQFNTERAHQALEMKSPSDGYQESPREYQGLPDLTYPGHDTSILISTCGRICFKKMKLHLSRAFANQSMGLKEVDPGIWLADFKDYTLGYFDAQSRTLAPNDDPFGIRLTRRCSKV